MGDPLAFQFGRSGRRNLGYVRDALEAAFGKEKLTIGELMQACSTEDGQRLDAGKLACHIANRHRQSGAVSFEARPLGQDTRRMEALVDLLKRHRIIDSQGNWLDKIL